jgi:hypothetical protein
MIFKIQKIIIRIIANSNYRTPCCDLFKKTKHSPLKIAIYSVFGEVLVGNLKVFSTNTDINSFNTHLKIPPAPSINTDDQIPKRPPLYGC